MIKFEVRGQPQALKRHRSTVRGGIIRQYDPSAAAKRSFLLYVINHAPKTPIAAAISIKATFCMTRPKSHFRTGKYSSILKDNAPTRHTGRPDLDNLIKFVSDALNGVFYKDDSQIDSIAAVKFYDVVPRTEIEIDDIC